MQERLRGPPCHCHLCIKAKEIAGIKQQRRELSLNSIYRKDYKIDPEVCSQQIPLPPNSARKNQSNNCSNFHGRSKSYLEINSTYLANYLPNTQMPNPQGSRNKNSHIREQDVLESYLSTYSNVHRKLPVLHQESYKITDNQAYTLDRPFPKQTEYTKNYQPAERGKESQHRRRNHNFQGNLRLFQTTQKQAYGEKVVQQQRPMIPTNNVTTLPTSSFLYNTTYKQQYLAKSFRSANPECDIHGLSDKYRF